MKSIEKLREYVDRQRDEYNNHNVSFVWQLSTIADEIEAEIAANYMELPVDADGVPIHIDDVLECDANGYKGTFSVFAVGYKYAIGDHEIEWIRDNPDKWFHFAAFCHHVKPRSIEDVLNNFAAKIHAPAVGSYELRVKEYAPKYADEIRWLLGGDA